MNTPDSILARQRAEDARRTPVREERRQPYGTSSSYQPASDGCPAPFVPAADVYSPPPAKEG